MTIRELIETLQDLIDCEGFDPETPVRLQTQPNYPHENAIGGLTTSREIFHDEVADAYENGKVEEGDDPEVDRPEDVVFITEGSWIGYGSRRAFSDLIRR